MSKGQYSTLLREYYVTFPLATQYSQCLASLEVKDV